MNTSVCEPPSSSILLQSGLILRTPKELFVWFPFQHSKTFSKVKIWAAFVCALAGGRGYEVHNCLLSRVITHGYLGKRHQKAPKTSPEATTRDPESSCRISKEVKIRKRIKVVLAHHHEEGGVCGTTEWFHYFLAQPASHCSLPEHRSPNHHCHQARQDFHIIPGLFMIIRQMIPTTPRPWWPPFWPRPSPSASTWRP